MEVHRLPGNGFQEVIYQRPLAIEMSRQGLIFSKEHEMDIYYKDEHIGTRRVDFFVERKIMLELKALIHLEDVHLAQAIHYLEAYGLTVGLPVNFGAKSLQYKRVMKPPKIIVFNHSNKSQFRQWQPIKSFPKSGRSAIH
jgi:GxxExxY protein